MGEQVGAKIYGGVAQLGEHLPCKQGVMSSNLTISICTLKTAYENILNKTSEAVIFMVTEQTNTQEFLIRSS